MKRLLLLLSLLAALNGPHLYAQTEAPKLQLSAETDLMAYTSLGGFSLWGTAQYHKNRASLAFVNYPNRYRGIYEDTGIREDDRFLRLALWRYWNDKHHVFYGLNTEYHWVRLKEDDNTEELKDTKLKLGLIVGYHWHPFRDNENALRNLSFSIWAGPAFNVANYNLARVFEQTGSVYNIPALLEPSIGINVSYTLYRK